MNTFWDGVLERHNNGHILFSPCTASGLAGAAPTDICFPWQRCVAQPQQQTAGCPLHTHDLRDTQWTQKQKSCSNQTKAHLKAYTLCKSPHTTHNKTVNKCICWPPHPHHTNTATESLTTVKIFVPGHNKVSSLKEATVSRDDSIVVALPSNILPETTNNNNNRFHRISANFRGYRLNI